MKFKEGDIIEVSDQTSIFSGSRGTITRIDNTSLFPVLVEFDMGSGYFTEHSLSLVASAGYISGDSIVPPEFYLGSPLLEVRNNVCHHKNHDGSSAFALYRGLIETFEYCEICDFKRNKQ